MQRKEGRLIRIEQPFTIVVEPASDGLGWNAKIIGREFDTIHTCADDPAVAVFMAWSALRLMTGRCGVDRTEHEYGVDTTIGPDGDIPAWGCMHCDVKTAKTEFEPFTIQ